MPIVCVGNDPDAVIGIFDIDRWRSSQVARQEEPTPTQAAYCVAG